MRRSVGAGKAAPRGMLRCLLRRPRSFRAAPGARLLCRVRRAARPGWFPFGCTISAGAWLRNVSSERRARFDSISRSRRSFSLRGARVRRERRASRRARCAGQTAPSCAPCHPADSRRCDGQRRSERVAKRATKSRFCSTGRAHSFASAEDKSAATRRLRVDLHLGANIARRHDDLLQQSDLCLGFGIAARMPADRERLQRDRAGARRAAAGDARAPR